MWCLVLKEKLICLAEPRKKSLSTSQYFDSFGFTDEDFIS